MIQKKMLTTFHFSLPNKAEALFIRDGADGDPVTVPHTWNVTDGLETYVGKAYYSTELEVQNPAFCSILHFEAVYHSCQIYWNGTCVGTHVSSGYTPFEIDVTAQVRAGKNRLVIACENTYTDQNLPYKKDFDWACDGGLIRPVTFIEYDANGVRQCHITSTIQNILPGDTCVAAVRCDIQLLQKTPTPCIAQILDAAQTVVWEQTTTLTGAPLTCTLQNAALWSPENPALYTLSLQCGEQQQSFRFGIRQLETRGDKILLNGREIKLLSVEWMPGSNPDYGMAEPESELRKNLEMLKDLHCNFTRFHWQQADFVLDWCDEHGLMVQEEIPYWGAPKAVTPLQTEIAKLQADDMLRAHYNHPSLVCWGVGNELNGLHKKTIRYAREMVSYFKARDPMRLVNYVSNTMANAKKWSFSPRKADAAAEGDICMWNDYLGSWMPSRDYEKDMHTALQRANGKPLVVSEFGLCEPHFKGGDPRRIEIYKEKLALYAQLDFAGWIYFCLNDYRTHIGESGEGKYRQRIHGSVDMQGNRKPSYAFIQKDNISWEEKQKGGV